MFINTIAVGPLDPVASCVTGGTTVASPRWLDIHDNRLAIAGRSPNEVAFVNNRRGVAKGARNAIAGYERIK
jgi:hypothetical protein